MGVVVLRGNCPTNTGSNCPPGVVVPRVVVLGVVVPGEVVLEPFLV